MRKYRLITTTEVIVEISDDVNSQAIDFEEYLFDKVEEKIRSNNLKENVLFYQNMNLICLNCGVTLTHDEEFSTGKCLQCENN